MKIFVYLLSFILNKWDFISKRTIVNQNSFKIAHCFLLFWERDSRKLFIAFSYITDILAKKTKKLIILAAKYIYKYYLNNMIIKILLIVNNLTNNNLARF